MTPIFPPIPLDESANPAFRAYLRAIGEPQSSWNLFELALHVARVGKPTLDFQGARQALLQIQNQIAGRVRPSDCKFDVIEKINQLLFEELGFRPNRENYYDPQNSFMDWVLESRRGIPISLSILYREVAGGLGLKLNCVSFPGHFLLSLQGQNPPLFLDAFGRGALLVESDCVALLESITGGKLAFHPVMLGIAEPPEVLLRMLANLKEIYRRRGQSEHLLRILNRRIPLLDDPLPEILERGILHLDLQCFRLALSDFEVFVGATRDEKMKALIGKQIAKLRILAAGN